MGLYGTKYWVRFFVLLFGLLELSACRQDETNSLSDYLDYIIENRQIFEDEKEERIGRLKNLLGVTNLTPEQEYEINTELYNEFRKYKLDSASTTSSATSISPASWATTGSYACPTCIGRSCIHSPACASKPTGYCGR